jgi:hypothetical protein
MLDVATPYESFMEEFGMQPAFSFEDEPVPTSFLDDPYNTMKFECSRAALYSVLQLASLHTNVGELIDKELQDLALRVMMLDSQPFSPDRASPFGEQRMRLMAACMERLRECYATAVQGGGIGSGQWPASFGVAGSADNLLGQSSAARSATRSHHQLGESESGEGAHHGALTIGLSEAAEPTLSTSTAAIEKPAGRQILVTAPVDLTEASSTLAFKRDL